MYYKRYNSISCGSREDESEHFRKNKLLEAI